MASRTLLCGAVLWLTLALASLFEPRTFAEPQFKSGTALVEVDVIVLDRQGRFVPGLQPSDLMLFEDGKPQQIQQFYMVTYDPGGEVVSEFVDQADHQAQRVFVLLFDEGHLAHDAMMRVKRGAEQFVQEQFGPKDIGGVFVDGAMHRGRLTNEKAQLIDGIRAVRPAFDNRQELLAPFRSFPRIPSELDAVRIADGARELVTDLAGQACGESPAECQFAGGPGRVENLLEQKAKFYVRQARTLTNQTLQNLRVVINGVSRIPGRKTIVFLTEGFFVEESRGVLQQLAAQAARAGAAIYSIDGRGNINRMGAEQDVLQRERGRSTAFDTGDDGPNILTAGTGGFMIQGIDDMSRAFGRIVRDTSTYYVIGYQPENAVMDGAFRKIDVKSRHRDHRVRARKGYAAVALPPQQRLHGGSTEGRKD
jgi:VWFA-related protein